jgi:hypothetical protein
MSEPKRIQLQRIRGWRKPFNTVVVSRPSKWGNPFTVAEYGRSEAVSRYRVFLQLRPCGNGSRLDLEELRGKNLGCWCRLDQVCHADVLLELANR